MQNQNNHLIKEKSPYLLQHVQNPVDWYPWGKEALARAREEDKPIFLSIGYSTCHWCHVMAHESFENSDVAELLNKWFVSIKVDREERPDIDQMYMAATQAMNGSGGWPLSVFLFPDGKPFYAATYIPPQGMYGRPGFSDILEALHTAWKGRRDVLQESADNLICALQGNRQQPTGKIEADVVGRAFSSLFKDYDGIYGGFGSAPKFPRPVLFNFLLQYYHHSGNAKALDMTLTTLQAMARGGMYDHLGGGFHRYSVDGQWRVPHFEKMLYDQAQLLNSYLDAFQITGDTHNATIAGEIAAYVLRDMRDPAGGFYSAEDADSADPYKPGSHGEGAFFLWTEEDIVGTLGAAAANIFTFCYGVEFDGNALHDPQKEFSGRNILYFARTPQEAAEHFTMDVSAIEKSLRQSRRVLFVKREQRIRPHLDDKIITAWNGLMIGALARAGAILDDQEMIEAAAQAAQFIRLSLFDPATGQLKRRFRDGEAGHAGQLDDYAFLVSGLLELYQVVQQPDWLEWAMVLMETSIELFWDSQDGAFFDSRADATLPVRMKGEYDGAEPAANSVQAMNLLQLGRLMQHDDWQQKVQQTLDAFSAQMTSFPQALLQMLCVVGSLLETPEQVILAGKRGQADTLAMTAEVYRHFNPTRILLLADGDSNQEYLGEQLPFLKTVTMQKNRATAYVCKDFACRLPVTEVPELKKQLERSGGREL